MTGLMNKFNIFKSLSWLSKMPQDLYGSSSNRFSCSFSNTALKTTTKPRWDKTSSIIRHQNNKSSHENNFHVLFASMGFSFSLLFGDEAEDDDIDSIKKIMLNAGEAIMDDQLNKSEQLFHLALKSAQELGNLDLASQIFAKLGFLASLRNEWDKAEKLFTKTLQLYFKLGKDQDDNAVIEVSLRLAEAYSQLGKLESAVEGFKYCIACQNLKISTLKSGEEADDDTLVLLGLGYDGLAAFLVSINETDLAKTYWEKALKICLQVLGEANRHTAVILSHLANLSFRKKDYAECEVLLERAIAIALEAKSADAILYYVSLAWVYKEKGLDTEAEELFVKSLDLANLTENEAFIKKVIDLINGQE